MHQYYHPASSREKPSGLPYWRAPTLPTQPQRSPRLLPLPRHISSLRERHKKSNRAQPLYCPTVSPSSPANPENDVMLVASTEGSDGNSDYVKSAGNSPTSPSNTTDLAGHISKLEAMHEVSEGYFNAIARPTVLLSHANELKIPELADAETDPPENHQDNGDITLVSTQPSPPHSPLEDTLVASA